MPKQMNETILSDLYQQIMAIIEGLNKTKTAVSLAKGVLVSPDILANMTMAKNESLTALVRLNNFQLNVTTGDRKLAHNFIDKLTQAQDMLNSFWGIVSDKQTYYLSTTTPMEITIRKKMSKLTENPRKKAKER